MFRDSRFFLVQLKFRYQAIVAFVLLAGHSALYLVFPGPEGAFQPVTNIGAVIDRALMGHNYLMAPCVNLNLIPEIASVLFGVWIGNLIRSNRARAEQCSPFGDLVCSLLALQAEDLPASVDRRLSVWP